jgi:protein-ribulosamine 3-kinase
VSLSEEVRTDLEAGLGSSVARATALSGGCISPAFRAVLADGRTVFVKIAPPGVGADVLRQESLSLGRIEAARAVRVPHVLGVDASWLALEWLEPAGGTAADWALLGRQLARLHGVVAETYGWSDDNYIGPLPQPNSTGASWAAFWAERRLRPQVERAGRQIGRESVQLFERLLDELEERLQGTDADGPSLLHGDLWSGNVHMTAAGPSLIDPASYFGHREVDLAMAALFGGFPREFQDAYDAEWPPLPGVARRRPIYQLYYLLVHVNLFGASYLAGTERALRAALL